jgi:hypothetical protein
MNVPTAISDQSPAPPTHAAAPPSSATSWTERWLGARQDATWLEETQRLLVGAALASLFGAALGLRAGGLAIPLAAVGAPMGIVAVAAVGVPSFAIVLALANAPLRGMDLARATSRAALRAGLLLAGVAPGAALLAVTCEERITVAFFAFGGLLFAGAIAGHSFARDLRPALAAAPPLRRVALAVALPTFLVFAAVLAARVWWLALPMLTEAP